METSIQLVVKEREKQIKKHGYTILQDVEFNNNRELAVAASALLTCDREHDKIFDMLTLFPDSWDKKSCKNMLVNGWKDRVKKSAALLLAELDRILEIEKSFSNPVLTAENMEQWKAEFNLKMKLYHDLDKYIPEMIGDDWQTDLYEGYTVDDAIKAETDEWRD